jgi:hypothetical protein
MLKDVQVSGSEKGLFCWKPTMETKPASPPLIANPADYEASPWPRRYA